MPLHNKTGHPVTYQVETDLINPEGAKEITIEPHSDYNYVLKVTPILGGIYNGSITFIDVNNQENYVWFTA